MIAVRRSRSPPGMYSRPGTEMELRRTVADRCHGHKMPAYSGLQAITDDGRVQWTLLQEWQIVQAARQYVRLQLWHHRPDTGDQQLQQFHTAERFGPTEVE